MTQIVLPNTSVTGANLWSQVEDNDQAIVDVVNGDIGTDNLANGAVTGAKIASSTTANATLSGATGPLVCRKYADGLVTIAGTLTPSSGTFDAGEIFATLPAGYRPANDFITTQSRNTTSGVLATALYVEAGGDVLITNGAPGGALNLYIEFSFHAA